MTCSGSLMRTPDFTTRFNRDYKRECKGRYRFTLEADLRPIIAALLADQPLPASCRDHPLQGSWADHRDCHIKPDLVLIYQKIGTDLLRLVRLGSRAELKL